MEAASPQKISGIPFKEERPGGDVHSQERPPGGTARGAAPRRSPGSDREGVSAPVAAALFADSGAGDPPQVPSRRCRPGRRSAAPWSRPGRWRVVPPAPGAPP